MFSNQLLKDQNQNSEKTTDEICQLFSETLHSLAADASAIRQLTSLATLCGIPIKTDNVVFGGENLHPNRTTNFSVRNEPLEPLKGLRELDAAVTSIETKVEALRGIVTEEKRALEQFEKSLKEEADDQNAVLKELQDACQVSSMPQGRQSAGFQSSHGLHSNRPSNLTASTSSSAINHRSTKKSSSRSDRRRDSVDPRGKHQDAKKSSINQAIFTKLSLPRVTEAELKTISRNTRGRIKIIALNEALQEIEQLWNEKSSHLPRYHHGTTTTARERRFAYLKQQRANVDLEVDAHAGHQWVSEQELRENCAFFRFGESTARATLAILCSLKRLKQVPGKNMGVTYICLSE